MRFEMRGPWFQVLPLSLINCVALDRIFNLFLNFKIRITKTQGHHENQLEIPLMKNGKNVVPAYFIPAYGPGTVHVSSFFFFFSLQSQWY